MWYTIEGLKKRQIKEEYMNTIVYLIKEMKNDKIFIGYVIICLVLNGLALYAAYRKVAPYDEQPTVEDVQVKNHC